MATLNVKNLPDALYKKLKKRAASQRRSIAQEVTQILADALAERESTSILELRGMTVCRPPVMPADQGQ